MYNKTETEIYTDSKALHIIKMIKVGASIGPCRFNIITYHQND